MARPDARAHLPEKVIDLDDREHYSDTSRIKGLSDGVFAIAMTLLAFSLLEHVPAEGELALGDVATQLLIYAMSFIILGTYWVGHAIQFHYVERSDRPLMVRTVLFLLFISLVPFSAYYLGRDAGHTSVVAIGIYCANLIACGLFLHGSAMYATKDPLLLSRAMDRRIYRGIRASYLAGPILYLLAFLTAFANVYVGFALCVLTPILTFFPNPFWGRLIARAVGNRAEASDRAATEPRREG